jgi:hypothetical protein
MSDAPDHVIATIQKNAREELRIALTRFKEYDLISLRVWASGKDGDAVPTKAGFALRVALLPELRAAIEEAEREARAAGLLGDGKAGAT